jgi:hypothetical protein
MSVGRLREELLSSVENTVLVVCYQLEATGGLELVGHAFATAWDYEGGMPSSHLGRFLSLTHVLGRVGWVTQLVVSLLVRKRYIATSLLQMLKSTPTFRDITAIGLVSSHPSACHALAKYTGTNLCSEAGTH